MTSRKARAPILSASRVPCERKPGKILSLEAALGNERRVGLRLAVAAVTIALWLVSVFFHKEGGQVFAAYFKYGATHWGGGTEEVQSAMGRAIAERLIFSVALVLGVLVLALTLWHVLRSTHGRRAFPELVVRGFVGLLACWAANRYWICIQSEDVHFAQYGFVAFGLSLALRSPRAGFALAVFCGFLDESNQWWRMYFHEVKEHLDWSDMCLNTCGACCGALPWTALARLRRYAEAKEDVFDPGNRLPAALGVAGIALIVVFPQKEGIPGLLALAVVLYYVVDERRRTIPLGAIAFALIAWHVGLTLPSDKGEPLHEKVPEAVVPKARGPIAIDGKLDEKDWERALKVSLGPFEPDPEEEDKKKQPTVFGAPLRTEARLLWDDNALYVAFECESKDVWGRDLPRDHMLIANTPCVEVFLDPDNAERTYYEFEVSAANRQADYFCYIPEIPQWVPLPTSREFVNLVGWDSKNFQSAVSVDGGELDLVPADGPLDSGRQKPPTRGYTVEMAIPWRDMQGRACTTGYTIESPLKPGAKLRLNLYRIESYRPGTTKVGEAVVPTPVTYMAWSPTYVPLDFHRPQFFGQITLGE
jgi:hypothetical protein